MNFLVGILLALLATIQLSGDEEKQIRWSVSVGFSPSLVKLAGKRDDYDIRVERNLYYAAIQNSPDVSTIGKNVNLYNLHTINYGKYDRPAIGYLSFGYRLRKNWEIGAEAGNTSYQPYFTPQPINRFAYYWAGSYDPNLALMPLLNIAQKSGKIRIDHRKIFTSYIIRFAEIENYYKAAVGYNQISYDDKDTQKYFTSSPSIGLSTGINFFKDTIFLEASATRYYVPESYKHMKIENVFNSRYISIDEYSIIMGIRLVNYEK